jgi:hypothetical protein
MFTYYIDGYCKSIRAMGAIAILWVVTSAGMIIFINPLQSGLEMVFGNSMTTELLYEGFELEFVGELLNAVVPVLISFSWVIFMVGILVYLAGVFVTAGIFRVIFGIRRPFRKGLFFMGADRGFAGYLLISLVIGLLVITLSLFLIIAPLIIAVAAGSEIALLRSIAVAGTSSVILLMPFIMAAADYARVNLVADKWEAPMAALKNGFRFVRGNYLLAYSMMVPFLAASLATSWLIYLMVTSAGNSSLLSSLLIVIVSSSLLFIKVWIKTLRYSTFTALYESVEGG